MRLDLVWSSAVSQKLIPTILRKVFTPLDMRLADDQLAQNLMDGQRGLLEVALEFRPVIVNG